MAPRKLFCLRAWAFRPLRPSAATPVSQLWAGRTWGNRHPWEHGRGDRSPPGTVVPHLLLLLLLLCAAAALVVLATAGSLSVEMPGRPQIAYVNDSVTLSCQVPGCPSLDTRIMGVTWYQKDLVSEAEVKVLELYGDQQKAFRRGATVRAQKLKRGDASLQLPGVGLGDAGEYRCELTVTPQKAKGWVLLEVLAKPDSTVFLENTKVSGKGRRLVCQSSGFYPEAINITWEKWTQKVPQHQGISKDICTGPTIKNKDGVFSISSYLKLSASLEDNGTIYQCVVEHPSLSISQRVNFTLLVIEAEKIYLIWILVFSFFGPILMLVLFLYIWRRVSCS